MYYFLIIVMQVVCIYHIITKKNEWWWILLVLFVPLIGCMAYIFMKMMNQKKIGQEFQNSKTDLTAIFNPGGKIKELEKKVEFSDTFVNKVALGDAYLVNKMYDEAIAIYESTRKGVHKNDPHVSHQLINAHYHKNEHEKVIEIAKEAQKNTAFNKSNSKVLYALSLESMGEKDQADKILQSMNGQYSNLEPRIIYAKFLERQNREADAKTIYSEIVEEASHMSNFEMKSKRQWVEQARAELKKF